MATGAVKRLEPGDLLSFLYALVLAREAAWLLPAAAAWTIAGAVALSISFLRLRARPSREPLPRAFWLVFAVPLALFWSLHLAGPDTGFDVLNYHLMHGERALRGLLAIPGDFYPYYFPFVNPAPDMVAGLFRHALGYRLGTVGSLLVLLWTGAILFRALERVVASPAWRAAAALWIVGTEAILWEVGGYMADLWALPLLLEALLLALPRFEESDPLEDAPLLALLLGTAIALKPTNLLFAAPIGVVFLWRLRVSHAPRDRTRSAARLLLAALLLVLPAAPHLLYLWWTTGSPLFPNHNALFRSPLFPPFDVVDVRWGPRGLFETAVWPLVALARPERFSELGATSGRLALGLLSALAALATSRRDRSLRGLALAFLGGALLFGAASGYQRYGVFLDLLAGLLFVLLAAQAIGKRERRAWRVAVLALGAVAALQSVTVLRLAERGGWSGPSLARRLGRRLGPELRRLGNDRCLESELAPRHQRTLEGIEGWVDVAPKTNGLMALLRPDLPMIGFHLEALLDVPENRSRLDQAFRALEGRRLASLALDQHAEDARRDLARHGFAVEREERLLVPLFSRVEAFDMTLFLLSAPPPLPGTPLLTASELVMRRPPRARSSWIPDGSLPGSLDEPAEGSAVAGDLLVRGGARRSGEDLEVTLFLDGEPRLPASFRRTSRRDVAAAPPGPGEASLPGFEALVPFDGKPGVRELVVRLRTRDGRQRWLPPRTFTWTPPPSPQARLSGPSVLSPRR